MDQAVVLYSLFGPFIVWLIEYLLPYPYIVEELFKSVLVFLFPQKSVKVYIYSGIAFALSETVLYSISINAYGSLGLLFTRLLTTSVLHSFTFSIIYLFSKKNKLLIIPGFIVAALIHYLYNLYIPTY